MKPCHTHVNFWGVLLSLGVVICGSGCSTMGSTSKRTALVSAGAAAGALAGHAAGGDSLTTGAAAVAGAALTHASLGRDPEVLQEGFDQGYLQGQSDAIKREYFLRQAREAQTLPAGMRPRSKTYCLPGPKTTPDGRVLQPQLVPLRVVE